MPTAMRLLYITILSQTPVIQLPFSIMTTHRQKTHLKRCYRLQEVLTTSTSPRRDRSTMIRHGREDFEIRLQLIRVQGHDTRDVAAAVAVIRRRPDSHDILRLEMVLVAFVDELVGARDEGEGVDVIELCAEVSVLANKTRKGCSCERVRPTSVLTLSPNNHPAPRGETAQVSTSSGSLHTRSQKAPS